MQKKFGAALSLIGLAEWLVAIWLGADFALMVLALVACIAGIYSLVTSRVLPRGYFEVAFSGMFILCLLVSSLHVLRMHAEQLIDTAAEDHFSTVDYRLGDLPSRDNREHGIMRVCNNDVLYSEFHCEELWHKEGRDFLISYTVPVSSYAIDNVKVEELSTPATRNWLTSVRIWRVRTFFKAYGKAG